MFAPCPSCRRHVRVGESSCPFCAASTAALTAPVVPVETARLARSWLAAAAIGGALAGAACTREPRDIALYGAPPRPTATSEPTADEANVQNPPSEPVPAPSPTGTSEPTTAPPPSSAQPIPPSPTGEPTAQPGPQPPLKPPPIALYGAPPPPHAD